MKTLYIGPQKTRKDGGTNWKLYSYFFLFLLLIGTTLRFTGSIIVEKWINKEGASAKGYAFSIRDVEISFGKGQMTLKDVKVFNPKTSAEILESPNLIVKINWSDLIMYQDKNISVVADEVDLSVSKDLAAEIDREKNELKFDSLEAKIAKLNIIDKKEDQSRKMLELTDANFKLKNKEFNVSSNIADGGKLNLNGKLNTTWNIQGSLKQVPSDIFNKIAGDKLPFAFNESNLNAEIEAHTESGKVIGEISPEIRKLNILNEKPGVPTQSIARLLTDELDFTLPFVLKDELKLQYADTYTRLKNYRKYSSVKESSQSTQPEETKLYQAQKSKKQFSFWPF